MICQIHVPLAFKKKHPVLAEGWRGSTGDTDALEQKRKPYCFRLKRNFDFSVAQA